MSSALSTIAGLACMIPQLETEEFAELVLEAGAETEITVGRDPDHIWIFCRNHHVEVRIEAGGEYPKVPSRFRRRCRHCEGFRHSARTPRRSMNVS